MSDFYNDVYNQEGKEIFLDSININKYPFRWWERLFEKTIELEEKNQKDLYNFTTPEILELYKFLDVKSLESLMIYNINLVKYGDWALMNNLSIDGQNHFSEIDNELLADCINPIGVNKSVITEEQLEDILRQLDNAMDKYVFYALWEGIKGKEYSEILELRMVDINEATKEVSLSSGRIIKVSDRFIAIAKEADQQTTYISYSGDKIVKRPLIPANTIYKDKHNSHGADRPRTIYGLVLRSIKKLGLSNYLSINSIYYSGFIYHLNKIATANNITVEQVLANNTLHKEVVYKYNFNISIRKRFLLKYRNFLI